MFLVRSSQILTKSKFGENIDSNFKFVGGCGSFYSINIKHESFKGMSVIKQHRKVNEILKEEITEMHGLQVGSLYIAITCIYQSRLF